MIIDIPNERIEQMIKEQVDASIRTRIKEMQGNYTSKGYLEELINNVICEKIYSLCPDIESHIKNEVERCIASAFEQQDKVKFTKKQLVEQIVDNLMERF
jgi:uncharacterized protein YbcI